MSDTPPFAYHCCEDRCTGACMAEDRSTVKERWVIQHINEWESPHYYVEGAPLTTNSDNATGFTKEQAEALVKTEDFVECRRGIYTAVWCPLTRHHQD